MTEDRESIRSFVVKELAKSDRPAIDAAVDWIVGTIQEDRRREQVAAQASLSNDRDQRQARSYSIESEHVAIMGLVVGAALGWAFSHDPVALILLGATAAAVFSIVRYGRSALATVGWLGVAGFAVGIGGWAWTIYCLGNKEQFSVAAMIVPTVTMWALGMFMLSRGHDRQKARAAGGGHGGE